MAVRDQGQALPLGRDGHAFAGIAIGVPPEEPSGRNPGEPAPLLARGHVPHPQRLVRGTARDERLAVWREGETHAVVLFLSTTREAAEKLARGRVGELDRAVAAPPGQELAIGRER